MIPVLVLLLASLLFRGIGAIGVESLASWQAATRWGLAVMLLFTASAHFTTMKEDLVRLVPPWIVGRGGGRELIRPSIPRGRDFATDGLKGRC